MVNSTISNSVIDNMYWQQESGVTTEVNGQLGKEDFFTLLTKQLSMQDPMNPTSNEDMIAQMTTFTMAEGITDLGDKFDQLTASMTSNQALEASSLVGRNVLTASSVAFSDGSGIGGQIAVPSNSQNVIVEIKNSSGGSVFLDYGNQSTGMVDFEWDGKGPNGEQWPAGQYEVSVTALQSGDTETSDLTALTYGRVSSVTLGQNGTGLELNVQGMGSIGLSDVLAVGE
jgi:flagellar basal-body rod modification protein FlgD